MAEDSKKMIGLMQAPCLGDPKPLLGTIGPGFKGSPSRDLDHHYRNPTCSVLGYSGPRKPKRGYIPRPVNHSLTSPKYHPSTRLVSPLARGKLGAGINGIYIYVYIYIYTCMSCLGTWTLGV